MAESGFELNLDEAEKRMEAGEELSDFVDQQSYLEPEWFANLENLEYKDLQMLCQEAANKYCIEMTPQELKDIIQLLLELHYQERSF